MQSKQIRFTYTLILSLLSAALLPFFDQLYACPGALFGLELIPFPKAKRGQVFIYKGEYENGGDGKKHVKWSEIPIQIEPVDEEGHIIFSDSDQSALQMQKSDLLLFNPDEFGNWVDLKKFPLPCIGKDVYQLIERESSKYAYVTICQNKIRDKPKKFPVYFDLSKHLLESESYRYQFNRENYMQFDGIHFKNSRGEWENVASDSRLMIRSDVKSFFTLNFDSKQIESKLEKYHLGPVGDLARLSFYLTILFFKLDMSLSTDVAFFKDSGHIPMMINLPVDSYEYLNQKSGILYSWILSPKIDSKMLQINMPVLSPQIIAGGWEKLGRYGASFCKNGLCLYTLGMNAGGRKLAMNLEIKSSLVERGFFPQFVDDVQKWKEAMGWTVEPENSLRRVGMYFEFSGLPKGGHPWNFWLQMGSKNYLNYLNCPVPLAIKKLSTFLE